jgi:DNA-binding NarL/FixJ family response regulator
MFALVVQGLSNKEIAQALKLAESTVKIHVAALFTKLGIRGRAAAAGCAAWGTNLSALPT